VGPRIQTAITDFCGTNDQQSLGVHTIFTIDFSSFASKDQLPKSNDIYTIRFFGYFQPKNQ